VLEAVSAWRVVVSCGQEGRVLERFERLSRDAFRRKLRVMGLEALLGCTMTLGWRWGRRRSCGCRCGPCRRAP
jgi:hypothetical protein